MIRTFALELSSVAFLFGIAASGTASGATPTVFASCPQLFEVNGLAATQSKLLFTTQSQPNVYQVNASGGSCTVFAVLPTPAVHPPVWEEYIAISPGVGGFAAGDIYVTQFENVYKISPDGSTVTLFATIPAFVNHDYFHSGITFDTSGNYGNKMIVTGQNFMDGHGQVYTISSAGTVTLLANVGGSGGLGITEGPVVTLGNFTPAPGRLLVCRRKTLIRSRL